MSALPKPQFISEEEFLAREALAERRSEYFAGEMFAMAGGTHSHARIITNLARAIGNLLDGKPCYPLTQDMMVKIEATGLMTYPDLLVQCETALFAEAKERVLLNPSVIIEVLSDTTERYDRTTKFKHYKQIPSLREYALIASDAPLIDIYTCQDDATWVHSAASGLDATLKLASLGISLSLTDIFARVTLPDITDRPR